MPTTTYTPLATIDITGTPSTVTFSSISQAYTDLVLVIGGTTAVNSNYVMRFNSDTTASNYKQVIMYGDGSTTGSYAQNGSIAGSTNSGANILNIFDYSKTNKHKTSLLRFNNSASSVAAYAQRWLSTAAITSIELTASNLFGSGITITLYGIAA